MQYLEKEIRAFVETIWTMVLRMDVKRNDASASPPTSAIEGRVRIRGGWHGTIVIQSDEKLANRAASKMLCLASGTKATDKDAQDAIAELTNILGGNLKALLPGPSQLGIPVAGPANDHGLGPVRGHMLSELAFHCDALPLRVRLFEDEAPAGAGAGASRSGDGPR
jgi:chemotaxis protein CheX